MTAHTPRDAGQRPFDVAVASEGPCVSDVPMICGDAAGDFSPPRTALTGSASPSALGLPGNDDLFINEELQS